MSGFLQRMASGMLHSERTIHPSVGSVWATPRGSDADIEAIETASETLLRPASRYKDSPAAMQPERRSVQETAIGQIGQSVSARPAETPAISPFEPEPVVAEAAHFEPLVALPPRSAAMPPSTAREPAQEFSQVQEEKAISRRRPESPEERLVLEPYPNPNLIPGLGPNPDPTLIPEQQAPLMRRSQTALRPPAPLISAPVALARRETPSFAPPGARGARQAPAQPPSREPDEIEIHIGRIEVLAAPPRPAQSAAARPVRKPLDLVEYLRRDRRAK